MRKRELEVSEDKIREAFDNAAEERAANEAAGKDSRYVSGIANALGWVLGEYEEAPDET